MSSPSTISIVLAQQVLEKSKQASLELIRKIELRHLQVLHASSTAPTS